MRDHLSLLSLFLMLIISLAHVVKADDVTKTDVFTSGTEGYHTFRIPSLLVTKEGTLLAICEGRKTGRSDHGDLDLIFKRSNDGGKTWGQIELIYEEGGDKKITIGNPCPVVDQSTGTIWMPFCRDNDDVLMTHSDDDGKTWSKPIEITADVKDPKWGWYATGPGVGIQLTYGKYAGRLVIPCDHRVGEGRDKWNINGHSHAIYSDDQGKTWQRSEPTDASMNECQVVELSNGDLMLNMRSYRGKGQRAVAISKDGGETWSHSRDEPALIEPVCQASLLGAFGEGSSVRWLLFSNPASSKSRHQLTVRASSDEGKSWPHSLLLHDGPAAYSCLTVLPNGQIGCLYEAGEKSAYEKLVFARFTVNAITEGANSVSNNASGGELFVATPLTKPGEFTAGIEGPACDKEGNVYAVNFAQQGTIGRVTPDGKGEIHIELPNKSVGNGIRFDKKGTMYIADYANHNVLKVDSKTKKISVHGHEASMSQPNDLAIGPDGVLWASDPNWGNKTGRIWRVATDGKITLAADEMGTTNGIEVSPDGTILYVNESVQRDIWAFTIGEDGKLSDKRLLKHFEDHGFDGMRCDVDGNLYVTRYGKGTVVKVSPKGDILQEIDVLGASPSNLCFGGPDGCTVYVTEVKQTRLVQFRVDKPGLAWKRWQEK